MLCVGQELPCCACCRAASSAAAPPLGRQLKTMQTSCCRLASCLVLAFVPVPRTQVLDQPHQGAQRRPLLTRVHHRPLPAAQVHSIVEEALREVPSDASSGSSPAIRQALLSNQPGGWRRAGWVLMLGSLGRHAAQWLAASLLCWSLLAALGTRRGAQAAHLDLT